MNRGRGQPRMRGARVQVSGLRVLSVRRWTFDVRCWAFDKVSGVRVQINLVENLIEHLVELPGTSRRPAATPNSQYSMLNPQ